MADARQQLLAAVAALYSHPDQEVKRQAGAWLEGWQQSLEAWSVADAVLHDASAPTDAQYFCAQTLRTKVQKDFEELPPESAASLRDSLLGLLLAHAAAGPSVRTQLGLALAAMAAHLPAERWGPGGVLQWLSGRLEGQPPAAALPVMLDMLQLLPEEARHSSRSVHPERRRQLQREMEAAAPAALQVLASCLGQPGAQTRARVLEAFAAWLQLTPGGGLPGDQLAQHPLVGAALEGLAAPETFDGSVEALVELIYSTASRGAPDQGSLALVQCLVPAVMGLLPRFAASARVARAEAEAEARGQAAAAVPGADSADDEDTMKGIARLFAEVGEAFTALIASGAPEAAQPVEALLEVAAHPSAEIAAMSFNFWHRLSRQLTSGFSGATGEASAAAGEARREQFAPAFRRLVGLVQGRVRYPQNWEAVHEDEKREFKHRRYEIADTLLDAACVLGSERVLQLLVEPLQALGQGGAPFDWRPAEAALFCIKSVHKVAAAPGQPTLAALFRALPQLPAAGQAEQLAHTAAQVVGAYAGWLAESLAAGCAPLQEALPQLLQMLISSMSSPGASGTAALALRDICDACGPQLPRFLDPLLQLFSRVQTAGGLAEGRPGQAVEGLALDEDDVQTVMEAVALAVSLQPEAPRRAALQSMLAQLLPPLQQALQAQAAAGGSSNGPATERVLVCFDRLTVVFRYTRDAGAVADALLQVWPTLEGALAQNAGSAAAVERLCRAPRYALRTAGKLAGAGDLARTMMAAVPQWFAARPHSSFLYVASELVKVFGDVPRQEGALAELLARLLERACAGLRELRQFEEEPELADDTFLLATRVLSYTPKLLLANAQLVHALLDSALAGLLVQHREAGESILSFLSRLLSPDTLERCPPPAVQQLQAALAARGPLAFRLLLAGVTGATPIHRTLPLSEALAALLKAGQDGALQWFREALALLPEAVASDADKARLLGAASSVARTESSKAGVGLMDESMVELSELARRNRRVREAATAALLPPQIAQAVR